MGSTPTAMASTARRSSSLLAQTNIEALKKIEYFTFAFTGETKLPLKQPVDYHLDYKDKLLTLTFTLPLWKPIAHDKIKDFSFAVYDPGTVCLAHVQRQDAGQDRVGKAGSLRRACR